MVFKRPFAHKSNSMRNNAINDQFRINKAAQVLPEKRIGPPYLFQNLPIFNNPRNTRDANLIMVAIKITKLDFGIFRDLFSFLVTPQIRNIHRETICFDRRDRAQTRLVTIHGGQTGESVRRQDTACKTLQFVGLDWLGRRFTHKKRPRPSFHKISKLAAAIAETM